MVVLGGQVVPGIEPVLAAFQGKCLIPVLSLQPSIKIFIKFDFLMLICNLQNPTLEFYFGSTIELTVSTEMQC